LVAAYALLSAIWAARPDAAVAKAALLAATVLVTFAASVAIPSLDSTQRSRAALAFSAGAFAGALFILFEFATEGAITRTVMNTVVWLKPTSAKHAAITNGEVVAFLPAEFRQHAAMLVFHLWPGLLALTAVEGRARRARYMGLLLLAVAVPVLLSDRMSAQLALIVSLLVFPLAYYWRRGVVRVLAALWCLGFVVIIPSAFLAYDAGLHLMTEVPKSARARMIIWEFTAERVLEHPWLGIGAASTAALKSPPGVAEQPEGFVYPRTTGSHAHDLFLQTWFELGLVGVILVGLAGAVLALRISFLPAGVQPFAAATFSVFLVTVSTAWSMWQAWLVCAAGLTVLYLLMAARPGRP
jgi:O-antigen ligase